MEELAPLTHYKPVQAHLSETKSSNIPTGEALGRVWEGFNVRGLWLCVASCKEQRNNVGAKLQMLRPVVNTHKRV